MYIVYVHGHLKLKVNTMYKLWFIYVLQSRHTNSWYYVPIKRNDLKTCFSKIRIVFSYIAFYILMKSNVMGDFEIIPHLQIFSNSISVTLGLLLLFIYTITIIRYIFSYRYSDS